MTQNERYNDVWQDCLDRLRGAITEEEIVKWFKPIRPINFDGANLSLRVPNESFVANIEKRYLGILLPIISELYGANIKIHYAIPRSQKPTTDTTASALPQHAVPTDTANIKNPFVIPGIRRMMFDPQLNHNYTFDNHIEGECNRLARSAGMAVAVNPGNNAFNPLYIYMVTRAWVRHILRRLSVMRCVSATPSFRYSTYL